MGGVAASVVVDNVLSGEDEIFTPGSSVEDTVDDEDTVPAVEDVEGVASPAVVYTVNAVEDVGGVTASVEVDNVLREEDEIFIPESFAEDTEVDVEDVEDVTPSVVVDSVLVVVDM